MCRVRGALASDKLAFGFLLDFCMFSFTCTHVQSEKVSKGSQCEATPTPTVFPSQVLTVPSVFFPRLSMCKQTGVYMFLFALNTPCFAQCVLEKYTIQLGRKSCK